MRTGEEGFSLVELLITMVVFVLVIAASSQIFTGLLTQFKQQGAISETNIEGAVGLEVLRHDLAQAGLGLPRDLDGATYREAEAESGQTFWVDRDLNDGPPDNPARGTDLGSSAGNEHSNPPAGIRSLNGDCNDLANLNDGSKPGIHNGATGLKMPKTCADVLAIKSTVVGTSDAAQKWAYITNTANTYTIYNWGTSSSDSLAPADFVTVVKPLVGSRQMVLKRIGTTFFTTFGNSTAYAPDNYSNDTYVIYDLGGSVAPRMPFNRADYYVKRPATGMPSRCAPSTGILYKATLNQSDGIHTEMPLLDCVADFQVDYLVDANGDGIVDFPPIDDISNLTAAQIRAELREVRVYIVAQEGRKDTSYDFSNNGARQAMTTLEVLGTQSQTRTFVNLQQMISPTDPTDPEYKYYRWKLYTLIVKPDNMR